jgi:PAS domain S-box-containing protein
MSHLTAGRRRDISKSEHQRVVFVLDLTERKRAEQALHEDDAKIRGLFDANIIGIFISELQGPIIEANDAFLRMLGYDREDLASGRIHRTRIMPSEWRDREALELAELKTFGTIQPFGKEYFRKDGSRVPVLIGAAALEGDRAVAFVLDLTEQKRAEAEARESERRYREAQMELAHANRVATMGRLTASIAHEMNQPIAAAVTNARAGLRWLNAEHPDLEEARQAFARILEDGNRASEVIGRIRALVEKAPPRKDGLAINAAILEVVAPTHGEAVKNGVSVRTQLAEGLPIVEGDRVQLQQVILNLIVNAIEAMSGTDKAPRDLLISTEKAEPDGVLVAARDSGPGLAAETLERLFDDADIAGHEAARAYSLNHGGAGLKARYLSAQAVLVKGIHGADIGGEATDTVALSGGNRKPHPHRDQSRPMARRPRRRRPAGAQRLPAVKSIQLTENPDYPLIVQIRARSSPRRREPGLTA